MNRTCLRLKRRTLAVTAILVLLSALSGTGLAATKTLRMGWVQVDTHNYSKGMRWFAQEVEKRTNGSLRIDGYPAGQLGWDRELFESVQLGTVDMAMVSTAVIGSFTPVLDALQLPWLLDYDVAFKLQEKPILRKLLDELDKVGVKGLAIIIGQLRHICSSRGPVNNLSDLKGLKFRVAEAPLSIDIFKSLGVSPVPVSFGELYTALQTGVVDAMEMDLAGFLPQRFYEVSKYLSFSGHFMWPTALIINPAKFKSLTPEQQRILLETAHDAALHTMQISKEWEESCVPLVKEKGTIVNAIENLEPFKEAVKPVYEKYAAKHPLIREFIEEVQKIKASGK